MLAKFLANTAADEEIRLVNYLDNKKYIQYGLIALIVVLFGIFVYPGLYEYDKLNQKLPVKINRLTGHTQVLNGSKWETVTDSDATKPDEITLLKAELAKNRETLKQELKKELVKEIKEQVVSDVRNDLATVKNEITAYQKFETDPENYFSVGSSIDEVKKIMGTPTSTYKYLFSNEESWYYSQSSIKFKNGQVSEYNNFSKNLRVK